MKLFNKSKGAFFNFLIKMNNDCGRIIFNSFLQVIIVFNSKDHTLSKGFIEVS